MCTKSIAPNRYCTKLICTKSMHQLDMHQVDCTKSILHQVGVHQVDIAASWYAPNRWNNLICTKLIAPSRRAPSRYCTKSMHQIDVNKIKNLAFRFMPILFCYKFQIFPYGMYHIPRIAPLLTSSPVISSSHTNRYMTYYFHFTQAYIYSPAARWGVDVSQCAHVLCPPEVLLPAWKGKVCRQYF